MLVIEPEKRMDVETALSHPFLSKYHDLSFEPRCNKKFDFAFEQDLVNLNTDVSVWFICVYCETERKILCTCY